MTANDGVTPIQNPKAQIQSLLSARGLAPKKSFGQNFMVDSNFAAAIARSCQSDEKTLVIEVGPGTGCLTQAILKAHPAARLLAIEIDRGLASVLREEFKDALATNRMTLIEGDVLASKHKLAPQLIETALQISAQENRPRRVLCANLPYNVATPLLANLAVDVEGLAVESAFATIQLEVAYRLFAKAGEKEYGPLAVLMHLRTEGRISRKAGCEIFWPRPQVESAVIEMRFRPWPGAGEAGLRRDEAEAFQDFLRTLFSQRRKTLRAALKPLRIPETSTVAPDARAEDIAPEVLLELFRQTRG